MTLFAQCTFAQGHVAEGLVAWVPCPAIFGGLGFAELLMIAFVSILVFGGRLPEVMRNLGQAYARIRRSLTEMSAPIRHEIQRATTLPPETSPLGQGLPDVATTEVPSVPYEPALPPALPEVGAEAPSEPPAPPSPGPWPRAHREPTPEARASPPPPAPATSVPNQPTTRSNPFDEPPPV